LENQLNHNVKIIRCDNGPEFKNHAMNEFCAKKGIKREFSVARTPQQNGVAKRKNMTLIKTARTMLANSLLPTPFWAEAVNTACYVLNRVLVTKPQNKTPYELLIGKSPSISFMRPFGCPLTILNTLDFLGKFDGKYDKGYLLGYSTSSKAFRVYNKRTKRVETRVLVEDVAPAAHEKSSEKDEQVLHDELEKMIAKAVDDATRQAFEEEKRNIASQKRATQTTSFNKLSTRRSSVITATMPYVSATSTPTGANAGESSFVYLGRKIPIDVSTLPNADLPIDLNMPDLEDDSDAFSNDGIINGAYDDENVSVVADFNNMDDTINVSPIPILKIHKDHPKDQILGDLKSAVQTRGNIQKASSAQQALKVWVLVDLPYGKKVIGTKWVFKNKRDERSIVVKNKVRLIAQGFRQEEGIDYDEVFAPVARIEAIRLFLAFASYMGFTVYQMDVKSAFLYGTIEEEVYVHQPPGFVDPAHPNKVYKKSMCTEFKDCMHKRFQMSSIATTPIESNKPLVKDEDGEDVDVHVYISMIGSLMYLTALRPDIMFVVCACTRFQVTPKASHLNAVKRIFRYLKHQPKLGLWYPRDSPFELEAFSDSDYGGASLDRKSTTEYVTAANCCRQNPVAHSRTKHIEIRFHFIRDCYEKRLIEVIKIHTDSNVADLLTKGFDVTRFNFLVDKHSMDWRMDRSCAANSTHYGSCINMVAFLKKPILKVLASLSVDFLKGSISTGELWLSLVTRVTSLEKELKETKQTLGNAVLKLVKKVKSLENALKRKSKKVIVYASEGEEPEDQERIIQDINDDPLVSLQRVCPFR
ncbi:putative ribonuclease H-like domain-containing protein, partial [Tanacetum coccineum]